MEPRSGARRQPNPSRSALAGARPTLSRAPSSDWPRWGAALVLLAGLASSVLAQAPAGETQRLRSRALAATCATCHGTDGRAVEGEALIRLAGLPSDYTLTQLLAFRTGQRPATIMHQITRGYSQEQLEEVAKYFAAQK